MESDSSARLKWVGSVFSATFPLYHGCGTIRFTEEPGVAFCQWNINRRSSVAGTVIRLKYMLRLTLIVLLLTAVGCLQSTGTKQGSPEMVGTAPLTIQFSKDTLTLDGTAVSFPAVRSDVIAIIGDPDRFEHDDGEDILVWDRRGLYAYEDAKTKKLVFFAFTFYKAGYTFAPATPFAGQISASNMTIKPGTTAAELQSSDFDVGDVFPYELSVGRNKIVVEIGDVIEEVAIGTAKRF